MKNQMLLLVLVGLSTLNAQAGREGHGGDALMKGDKLYLLDLLEAGVEDAPYFNDKIQAEPYYLESIQKTFRSQSAAFQNRLAQKLTEISKVSELTAIALTEAIKVYSFRFVDSDLVDVADEDSSLSYDPKSLVQLAIRRGMVILIARERWKQLSLDHQVGLITHEMVYAFAKLTTIKEPVIATDTETGKKVTTEVDKFQQLSAPARALNGAFYIDSTYIVGMDALKTLALDQSSLDLAMNTKGFFKMSADRKTVSLVRLAGLSVSRNYALDWVNYLSPNYTDEQVTEALTDTSSPTWNLGLRANYLALQIMGGNRVELGVDSEVFWVLDLKSTSSWSCKTPENVKKVLQALPEVFRRVPL